MLKATNLGFEYSPEVKFDFPSIHTDIGETLLLLGESGSGKTTFLHLLGGLLRPKTGEVRIGETVITKLSNSALDKFRGRHIGIIFQKPYFIHSLNVEKNLLATQYFAGLRPDKTKVDDLLKKLGIAHRRHAYPSQLSLGEQQRLGIARSLVCDPRIILADEPTSSLDDKNCREVVSLLEEQKKMTQTALIIVTHDQRLKAQFGSQIQL